MNDESQVSPSLGSAPPVSPEEATLTGVPESHTETKVLPPGQVSTPAPITPATVKVCITGYEILGELGRGGMGVVYKARHLKLNRIVALKMVLGSQHASERDFARFIGEAQAVAEIKHPNVIQIFDSGEANGHPYMAMECLEGGSLSQLLHEKGTLPPEAAAAR